MAIGINYFTPTYHDIDSKYSLGIRGLHPYIRARYKKEFLYNDWLVELLQSFRYSTKTRFKEETNVYFDKKINNINLFRINVSRNTQTNNHGMEYFLAFEYFYKPKKDIGISVTQSFLGDTKFTYFEDELLKKYSGINTYNTEMSFRQNIWKKWFFYEIRTGVDFQKKYNYKSNYKILFLSDFYFNTNPH